jgi:uncharacterized protein YhfF
MTWLPDGCSRPALAGLQSFWERAQAALTAARSPESGLPDHYQVRWIGLDDATTEEVIDLIIAGDKTGTFSLPWLIQHTGQPEPASGDCIILVDFGGRPRLLVRLTAITPVDFGNVTAANTSIDGSPVRALAVWIPLHTQYWNNLLAPFDLSVTAAMPVLLEKFELLYTGDNQTDGK